MIHALVVSYAGLVLQVLDAADPAGGAALLNWATCTHVTEYLDRGHAERWVVFTMDGIADRLNNHGPVNGPESRYRSRVTSLWFPDPHQMGNVGR